MKSSVPGDSKSFVISLACFSSNTNWKLNFHVTSREARLFDPWLLLSRHKRTQHNKRKIHFALKRRLKIDQRIFFLLAYSSRERERNMCCKFQFLPFVIFNRQSTLVPLFNRQSRENSPVKLNETFCSFLWIWIIEIQKVVVGSNSLARTNNWGWKRLRDVLTDVKNYSVISVSFRSCCGSKFSHSSEPNPLSLQFVQHKTIFIKLICQREIMNDFSIEFTLSPIWNDSNQN